MEQVDCYNRFLRVYSCFPNVLFAVRGIGSNNSNQSKISLFEFYCCFVVPIDDETMGY